MNALVKALRAAREAEHGAIDARYDALELQATVAQVATAPSASPWVLIAACGLAPTTRRRLTREGKLPVAKVGRSLMVRTEDVAKFIDSQVRASDAPDEFRRALRGGR